MTTNTAASNLTAREREVLSLKAQGFQNKHIAAKLRLSEATVKGIMRDAQLRLGAVNGYNALWLALRSGELT